MGTMSLRTKLLIFGIIIFGLILIITDKSNNPTLPPVIAILVGTLAVAVLADRSPRFRSLIQRIYSLIFIAIMGLGVIFLGISAIRGELPSNVVLVIFLPFIALVVLFFVVFYLGQILFRMGKPQAAIDLYSALLRINSKFGYAYFKRGMLRYIQKDTDNALIDFGHALEISKIKAASHQPQYFSVNYSATMIHALKAEIYLYKDAPQQAIAECNMGLALNEDQPATNMLLQNRRGYAQLLSANYDGALQDFNTIRFEGKAAVYEKYWAANLNALKSLALAGLARIDEARPLWQQAVTLDPNYANPAWLRDVCLWPENLLSLASQLQTA